MGSCCTRLKEKLDFELDDRTWKDVFRYPSRLVSGCGFTPDVYSLNRTVLALLWIAAMIWSLVDWVYVSHLGIGYYYTKLTHLGNSWMAAYLSFAAFSTYQANYGSIPDGKGPETPWFVQVSWFLGAAVPALSATIAILYWVLVYDGGAVRAVTVVQHGVNLAVAIYDLVTTSRPYHFAHVYVILLFATSYVAFTYIYYRLGGKYEDGVSPYIYKAVDWSSNPEGTGNLLGVIVIIGLPVLYSITYLIAAARVCCGNKCCPAAKEGLTEALE